MTHTARAPNRMTALLLRQDVTALGGCDVVAMAFQQAPNRFAHPAAERFVHVGVDARQTPRGLAQVIVLVAAEYDLQATAAFLTRAIIDQRPYLGEAGRRHTRGTLFWASSAMRAPRNSSTMSVK